RDRAAAAGRARDLQRHLDVELVVLALVGEGDRERPAGRVRHPVRLPGGEVHVAVGGAVEPGAVQAGAGGLLVVAGVAVAVFAAGGELLAEPRRDVRRRDPGDLV